MVVVIIIAVAEWAGNDAKFAGNVSIFVMHSLSLTRGKYIFKGGKASSCSSLLYREAS
jgi:hypothetical protein